MKEAELQAIKERADAATEGPWEYDDKGDNCINAPGFEVCTDIMWYDAEFIAAARQDVPKLLAEVERLKSKIETYESIAQECDYYGILGEMEGELYD